MSFACDSVCSLSIVPTPCINIMQAAMATDSLVVALEGQLLLLRERESRLIESNEALLARHQPPQHEGMEELIKRYIEGSLTRTVRAEVLNPYPPTPLPPPPPPPQSAGPAV